jgi:hypothetical protein
MKTRLAFAFALALVPMVACSSGGSDGGATIGAGPGGGTSTGTGGSSATGGTTSAGGTTAAAGGAAGATAAGGTTATGGASPTGGTSGTAGAPAGDYSHAVSIIVEPSDKGVAVVNAIKAAKKSIHMTMYLLSSNDVINALIAAKKAGVEVKVVLNKDFPAGSGTDNNAEYAKLAAGGVQVVWAPAAFTLTHEKCMIIDGATAWIMTMNLTFTSPTDNREFLAIDTDADDVAEAEEIFAADFTNTNAPISGKLLVAPYNAQPRLLALIKTATTSIDVEGEEFSDNMLTAALTTAAAAGVKVRMVLPDAGSVAQQKAIAALKAAGISVVSVATPYIHAKAMVVDGARAYVGSINFTYASESMNRELGLITDAPDAISKVATTIAGDFAIGKPLLEPVSPSPPAPLPRGERGAEGPFGFAHAPDTRSVKRDGRQSHAPLSRSGRGAGGEGFPRRSFSPARAFSTSPRRTRCTAPSCRRARRPRGRCAARSCGPLPTATTGRTGRGDRPGRRRR